MIKMKIKPQFLKLIREGSKTHEYRLAKGKFSNVKIDDEAILINSENMYDYEKVRVINVEHFNNWKDALKNNWEKDFKGYYQTYESVYEVCSSFYSDEDIQNFGINVFEISIVSQPLKNIRVLIDDELIIAHETSTEQLESLKRMYEYLDKGHCKKLIDSTQLHELIENKNIKNKDSFIKKYDEVILDKDISLPIFCAIKNNLIDVFVTNDNNVLKIAKENYFSDRILSTEKFVRNYDLNEPKLINYGALSIEKVKFSSIDVNDEFFDSLRQNYGGIAFNNWFNRKKDEECYIFFNDLKLAGFLYIKMENSNENYDHFEPKFNRKNRLKVGTFKINSTGLKLGERFIKIIIDNALNANADEIYVTLFENIDNNIDALRDLLKDWGFIYWGKNKNNGESIFVKTLKKYNYDKSPKFNYPLHKSKMEFGFLPIQDDFHDRMFPDLITVDDFNYFEEKEAVGYALEKIYVTNLNSFKLRPGDFVLIYRMSKKCPKRKYSKVTGLGIIQGVEKYLNKEEVCNKLKKRSVFTHDEIYNLSGDKLCIIRILYLREFSKEVNLKKLQSLNIPELDSGCRLTTLINKENFELILQEGGIEKI